MNSLGRVKQKERLMWVGLLMINEKLPTLLQKNEVHLFHRKIRGDETKPAIVRIGMPRQRRAIEARGGWHRHSITIDECIEPIGGWTAGGAKEIGKPMIKRATNNLA